VDCLCRAHFLLSGVPTGTPYSPAYVRRPPEAQRINGDYFLFLHYSHFITLVGRLDFSNLSDDESNEVLRNFDRRFDQSLMGIPALPGVNLQLCEIQLKQYGIPKYIREDFLGVKAPEPAVEPEPNYTTYLEYVATSASSTIH
jgi:hypothetical protein